MSTKTKAVLVISDLHLGEGKRLWDGRPNLLEDFLADEKLVEFLNFYSQAYDEVELVLNGNFFEMMRFRIQEDFPDILYEAYAVDLVRNLMAGHSRVIQALRRFMEKPNNRLVYLAGDSDRGILWPAVQEEIKSQISDRIQFETSPYTRDGIQIQHGHEFDPLYSPPSGPAFEEQRDVKVMRLPWGAYFQAHFVEPLRRVRPLFYRVRPMKSYLVWAFLFETKFFFRILGQFAAMIWKALTRKLYPGSSLEDVGTLFRRSADPESLEAYAERVLTDDAVQKLILGHSHIADYRQYANGKEYFNTGTWTRTVSLDVKSLGPIVKLTYVLLEYRLAHEPPLAKLMEWRGKHEAITDYF